MHILGGQRWAKYPADPCVSSIHVGRPYHPYPSHDDWAERIDRWKSQPVEILTQPQPKMLVMGRLLDVYIIHESINPIAFVMAPFVFGWGFPYKPTHPKRNETPCFFFVSPFPKKNTSTIPTTIPTTSLTGRNIPWMMPSIIASKWKKWQMTRCLIIQLRKWARRGRWKGWGQRSHYLGVELFFLEKEVDDGWERKRHLSTDVL